MKSVCLVGSQRFKNEMECIAADLRQFGAVLVYEPQFREREQQFLNLPERERLQDQHYRRIVPGLVFHHLQRIREADIIYVYNPGGYMGVNSTLEIGFAHALNKPIFVFSPEKPYEEGGEMCREILFNDIINSTEELFNKLK